MYVGWAPPTEPYGDVFGYRLRYGPVGKCSYLHFINIYCYTLLHFLYYSKHKLCAMLTFLLIKSLKLAFTKALLLIYIQSNLLIDFRVWNQPQKYMIKLVFFVKIYWCFFSISNGSEYNYTQCPRLLYLEQGYVTLTLSFNKLK